MVDCLYPAFLLHLTRTSNCITVPMGATRGTGAPGLPCAPESARWGDGFCPEGAPTRASIKARAGERDKGMNEQELIQRYRSGQRGFGGAFLQGVHLSGAALSGADLYKANFSRADLSGADLSGANLQLADLSRAHLKGA